MLTHTGTQKIETKRLILRRFTVEDAQGMFDNWATDENTVKFLSWNVYVSADKVKEKVSEWVEAYKDEAYYNWVIELKESNEIIGGINAHDLSEKNSNVEMGYCLGSKYWNNGYASEALEAVMDYLFSKVNMHRICALHDVLNPASGCVMKKAGMLYEGLLREHAVRKDGTYGDYKIYSVLRSEWKAKKG